MTRFAWMMDTPSLFGAFHICMALFMIIFAAWLAGLASRLDYDTRIKLLTITGWLLLASELFKQAFVYQVVSGGVYNYWYIPFQLCSVPMYLCILLPVLKGRARDTVLTFMAGYTFVSAAATFIYPEDILRPYIVLTLHGFDWHGVLLFISLTIGLTGMADLSFRGWLRSTYLFLSLSIIAIMINVVTEIFSSASGRVHGYASMFYLSPYHPSNQPVVGFIEQTLGRPAAMILYMTAVAAAAGIADCLFREYIRSSRSGRGDPSDPSS